MAFNLITSAWLEVCRASGARAVLRPADILSQPDDPVVALDFPRPDWNAAVTEFLIGLVCLAMAPEGVDAWAARFDSPPSPADLERALAPLAPWFDLDGEGPRAFQDLDPLADAQARPLSGLLIDAPGENALGNNADLFVKRGGSATLSPGHAAAALITLQTYAPAGGAGHRTSLRGGGPLTVLVAPVRAGARATTLWDLVWANTPDAGERLPAPERALPWLRPTETSQGPARVHPQDWHPALAFFACPRRIRLTFEDGTASGYRTLNYGAAYEGWRHPLSPYRADKAAGLLPVHPHAGASDYGDWLAWWGFGGAPAEVAALWDRRIEAVDGIARTGMEVFGYDMDNMKARQWLEARLPWLPEAVREGDLRVAVERLIQASDEAARALRLAVKVAIHGQRPAGAKDRGYRLPETLPKDTLPDPADRLWSATQGPFVAVLDQLVAASADAGASEDPRSDWLATLSRAALAIFDQAVDLDAMTDAEPRRLLTARDQLQRVFGPRGKALTALQLAPRSGAA